MHLWKENGELMDTRIQKWIWIGLLGTVVVGMSVPCSAQGASPSTSRKTAADAYGPALRYARASRASAAAVKDFQATFSKRERVKGHLFANTMHIKHRARPFSVYLRFYKPNEGREVIYVSGKNNGNLLAHESGIGSIVGTLALPPNSPRAMSEGRYPITEIGLQKMIDAVVAQWEAERKLLTELGESAGDDDTRIVYFHKAKLGNTACRVIQVTHTRQRPQYKFHITRLWIDRKTKLPVRVEQYGFPKRRGRKAKLLEEYTYTNIKTNVGLSSEDFDPRNPRYAF